VEAAVAFVGVSEYPLEGMEKLKVAACSSTHQNVCLEKKENLGKF
jgi:hypothetical protein